eukprot:scaffold5159_cov80-Skeletonema_dohrnii-CCMP3373.AAC.1
MHPLTAVPYWKGVETTCIALLKQLSCALKPAITIDASLLATSVIPATAASDDDATNKDHFSSMELSGVSIRTVSFHKRTLAVA